MKLNRTGKNIAFLDIHIGQPFFAHNKIWTRTSYEAATVLTNSNSRGSCCNFTIDECDKVVEAISISN